ncbi:hypothetical protein SDC9_166888 [bioreactor metagenome]|uniref:Uncharacterized protein n=1 Tax=bioreactor metagenome TaxID=1076179 RepID=A0A645FY93_9ZZZZ
MGVQKPGKKKDKQHHQWELDCGNKAVGELCKRERFGNLDDS